MKRGTPAADAEFAVGVVARRLGVPIRTVCRLLRISHDENIARLVVPHRSLVEAFGVKEPHVFRRILVGVDQAWSIADLAKTLGVSPCTVVERVGRGELRPFIQGENLTRFSAREFVAGLDL